MENKFGMDFEDNAEEAVAAQPADSEEAVAAQTENTDVWQNEMGQFIREDSGVPVFGGVQTDSPQANNIQQNNMLQPDRITDMGQPAGGIQQDNLRQVRPMMWEDTPLFSFMGRYGGDTDVTPQNNNQNNQEAQPVYNSNINQNNNISDVFNNLINNTAEPTISGLNINNPQSSQNRIPQPEGTRRDGSFRPQDFVLDGLTHPGTLFRESSPFDQTYKFINMPLPYDYNALEPLIDELTMHLHHDRHLQKYIDGLNTVLTPYPQYHDWRLERLLQSADTLPAPIRTAVINNGGGVYNHFFYFQSLTPRPDLRIMPPALNAFLTSAFKSVADFKAEFKKKALSVFGSGYAWLVLNQGGRPEITVTANQDTPLAKRQYPLLNIDVWEHAYYLKHHNMRDAYIENWFKAVNWHEVAKRLSEIRIRR